MNYERDDDDVCVHAYSSFIWHKECSSILSIDYSSIYNRLATAGLDKYIRIWESSQSSEYPIHKTKLEGHLSTINVIRFQDKILASGSDDGTIILWMKNKNHIPATTPNDDDDDSSGDDEPINLEKWDKLYTLSINSKKGGEIYDLNWLSDTYLIQGYLNQQACSTTIRYNNNNHKIEQINSIQFHITDKTANIQGVAIDPLYRYYAIQASNSWVKLYPMLIKGQQEEVKKDTEDDLLQPILTLTPGFENSTLYTFVRRLSFSKDGQWLLIPAGKAKKEISKNQHVTWIYKRNHKNPIFFDHKPFGYIEHLEASIVVRFNSIRYEPFEDGNQMVGILTQSSFAIYRFNHHSWNPLPYVYISNIHTQLLTDFTWAFHGTSIWISSMDGQITHIKVQSNSNTWIPMNHEKQIVMEELELKEYINKEEQIISTLPHKSKPVDRSQTSLSSFFQSK